MTDRQIVIALRKKGLSWKRIGNECAVHWRTARNWGTEKHNGPGPAASKLLRGLAVREGVL